MIAGIQIIAFTICCIYMTWGLFLPLYPLQPLFLHINAQIIVALFPLNSHCCVWFPSLCLYSTYFLPQWLSTKTGGNGMFYTATPGFLVAVQRGSRRAVKRPIWEKRADSATKGKLLHRDPAKPLAAKPQDPWTLC